MRDSMIHKFAISHAVGAATYIALVAAFMSNIGKFLGEVEGYLAAMMFLLFFVISAASMGILVFGRPVIWFLDGKKLEGIYLVIATIVYLILIALIVLFTIYYIFRIYV
jgi:hypothetical protein